MNREQILEAIRDRGFKAIKLPDRVGFSIQNGVLKIEIPTDGLVQNMQHNESAFEGWALCIKSCLNDIVDVVDIIWDVHTAPSGNCHYKRFIYRVWKFVFTYQWAKCSSRTFEWNSTAGWVANIPMTSAKEDAVHDEATLEREYITQHSSEYDAIGQQFPVGLFSGRVCEENRETPGSFLDIWAIKKDTLHIFELKTDVNKAVGIISELMFYVNVMNDIMKHRIQYEDGAEKVEYRGFDRLFAAYECSSINNIIGHFLTDAIHPFITPEVIVLMNNSPVLIKEKVCYRRTLVGIC